MLKSYREVINEMVVKFHTQACDKGWWQKEDAIILKCPEAEPYIVATRLCLIHSEIAEAVEGHRSDRLDDKLTSRLQLEVELADAVIRIFDIAGFLDLDIGGAIDEKMKFNQTRADHDMEERDKPGGKKY